MVNEDFSSDHEDELQDSDAYSYGEESESEESGDVMEFCVLSSEDIRRRVNQDVSEISNLLSVSSTAARLLLCKYRWNVSTVHEEWFSDEAKTRKNCGLVVFDKSNDIPGCRERKAKRSKTSFFCGICLEKYHQYTVDHHRVAAACGHAFCETCWKTYISTSIQDGPGCLTLNCPEPGCGASIGDMFGETSLVCPEDKRKYEGYVLRSYVESRKNLKWCPSPGCDFTVECLSRGFGTDFNVTCNCSYKFCWNCSEEIHTPADCKIVSNWNLKNSSESENTTWILSNTKPCPKCCRSIEKNDGCMHMRCRKPCDFEFCWLCLGPWSEHRKEISSYYSCNRYEEAKKTGKYKEADMIREMAKRSSQKYMHYFERWSGNEHSRKKAVESMKQAKHFAKLSTMYDLSKNELEFITKAWDQVVECRRVLKWSYAYGYYLAEDEADRRRLFEFQQGEAEANLERLHDLVEAKLPKLAKMAVPDVEEFKTFNARVLDLTKVTRNHFDNLVTSFQVDG